jgi:hypothetical protein
LGIAWRYDLGVSRHAGQSLLAYDGIRFDTGIPELALATERHIAKRVATLGAIDSETERELGDAHVIVERAPSVADLVRTLMWSTCTFDAVLVPADATRAVALAHALKLDGDLAEVAPLDRRMAARRHRRKPLFILPFAGDTQYGVVVIAQQLAYLEQTYRCPVSRAIVFFDSTRLIRSGSSNDDPGVA